MIQEKYEVILAKIVQSTGLPRVELEDKVQRKLHELQGMISYEGAAHIIANELNVNLFQSNGAALKVSSLMQGMNAVNVTVKVVDIFDVRTYTSKGHQGRVASFVVGDESGTTRLVVWDEKVIGELGGVKVGDVLKVKNGYVKQNDRGYKEVHLGNRAQVVINPVTEVVGDEKKGGGAARKYVRDVQAGEFVELYGTVVQIFEPKYYDACPVCNKKVFPQEGETVCQTHGAVTPIATPILNLFFDDSTGVIRTVLFREMAKQVLTKESFDAVRQDVLGKQFVVRGRVSRNEMFDRFEVVVSELENADPEKLIAELQAH